MIVRSQNGREFEIDQEDLWVMNRAKWYVLDYKNAFRVTGRVLGSTVHLARMLMGVSDRSLVVDHIDHNPFKEDVTEAWPQLSAALKAGEAYLAASLRVPAASTPEWHGEYSNQALEARERFRQELAKLEEK